MLEPGCGSGNFIGAAPTDTSPPTRIVGVELDPTSAAIARHLYPDAQIPTESFTAAAPDHAFDAAVGNVPFGDYWLYNPSQESIHNHFISSGNTRAGRQSTAVPAARIARTPSRRPADTLTPGADQGSSKPTARAMLSAGSGSVVPRNRYFIG
ncbi:Predicted O-methyltransferase [Marinactinospora thermotolerans DSM 45154]|uniref:Predicted O-methyltransferase n=1 Tax=Marinactinospora thermotolerans DSM 45154 TaxID=1122192 RepID=A0A1T4PC92_9ACTN|nr:Predicted O-methyltransferase [Marinactinospora thermotolerans DSM 45154]